MPDALWFTEDEEANRLLAEDPFALLVGFALDQQVTVQQAFLGPLRLKERLGTLEPGKVADFAVLDQDLYAIPVSAIGDTAVALTIASGQVVHGDE